MKSLKELEAVFTELAKDFGYDIKEAKEHAFSDHDTTMAWYIFNLGYWVGVDDGIVHEKENVKV